MMTDAAGLSGDRWARSAHLPTGRVLVDARGDEGSKHGDDREKPRPGRCLPGWAGLVLGQLLNTAALCRAGFGL